MATAADDKARTPKGEQTVQRLLDAAEQLFAEHGFAGTSIRDVASLAGLQKASFYNHFDSKDALYSAVLARGFQPMIGVMTEFLARGETAYDSPRLPADFFAMLAARPNFARLLQFECLQGGERVKPLLQGWVKESLDKGEITLRGSGEGKHWRPQDLHLLMFYTFAMMLGYFTLQPLYELYADEAAMTPDSIARQQDFLSRLWQQIWYREPA